MPEVFMSVASLSVAFLLPSLHLLTGLRLLQTHTLTLSFTMFEVPSSPVTPKPHPLIHLSIVLKKNQQPCPAQHGINYCNYDP